MEVELLGLLTKTLHDHGINVEEILRASARNSAERDRRLADRLTHSVLPLFIHDLAGRPDRIGSCVLMRVDSRPYAFTAGHVLDAAGLSHLFAPPGPRGKLLPLPYTAVHTSRQAASHTDLDVAVLPLNENELGPFANCTFLGSGELGERDEHNGDGFSELYVVFGYPASRTQVATSHGPRHIHQRTFQLNTSPPEAEAYLRVGISPSDYLLLEFDHKITFVAGKIRRPPKLQGLSGGGIIRFNRYTLACHLVAIAIEHRRGSQFIVGTRIRHFLELVAKIA